MTFLYLTMDPLIYHESICQHKLIYFRESNVRENNKVPFTCQQSTDPLSLRIRKEMTARRRKPSSILLHTAHSYNHTAKTKGLEALSRPADYFSPSICEDLEKSFFFLFEEVGLTLARLLSGTTKITRRKTALSRTMTLRTKPPTNKKQEGKHLL